MFKHKTPDGAEASADQDASKPPTIMSKTGQPTTSFESVSNKDVSLSGLRDLMEKNLKWSQILYEQNRKINRKLFWYSFASWIRTFFIVVPIILAIVLLPAAYQKFKAQYTPLLNKLGAAQNVSSPSNIQDLINLMPISDVERARLKSLVK